MLADRIRKVLSRRPYWGPRSVAQALDADYQVVRVTASREKIKFMDRYEVEAYVNGLVEAVEKLEVRDGQEERLPQEGE